MIDGKRNEPTHEILVLITYAQKHPLKTHVFVSSGARGLKFGLYFHLYPHFVYASSESICAGLPEPSLLVNISTQISCSNSNGHGQLRDAPNTCR